MVRTRSAGPAGSANESVFGPKEKPAESKIVPGPKEKPAESDTPEKPVKAEVPAGNHEGEKPIDPDTSSTGPPKPTEGDPVANSGKRKAPIQPSTEPDRKRHFLGGAARLSRGSNGDDDIQFEFEKCVIQPGMC